MNASYLDLVMAQQEDFSEEAEGGGGVWVVADLLEDRVARVTLEAISAARSLAGSLGAYVYAVLLGDRVASLAGTLYQAGADGVRVADHAALAPFAVEPHLEVLADLFDEEEPEIVLLGATSVGQALAPRLAQRLGGGLIEHVTGLTLDERTRAVRAAFPIYGGKYFEIRTCPKARPQILTVEPGAFSEPFLDEYRKGESTQLEVEPVEPTVVLLGHAEGFEPPDIPLSEATRVVSMGREAGCPDLVEQLAEALDAWLAGSRGAWDAGWVDAGQVVDVRDSTPSPELYIAVGVRGDTFHNAALEDADFIVAIHPDSKAPIFEIADLGVEAKPEELLPVLLEMLK
jgi:electron transfer flavoprotein alpha subunit